MRSALPGVEESLSLLVSTPRALTLIGRLTASLLAALVLALALVPWQQTVDGHGRVIAFAAVERQQEIDAPIEGRVAAWNVREGEEVRAGQQLLELADNDPLILDRIREEKVALVARREAAKARSVSINSRIIALGASRDAAVNGAGSRVRMAAERRRAALQAVDAATAARKTAQLNLDRQRQLLDKGLASARAFELAELDDVRASTELDRARATLQAAEAEAAALDSDKVRVGADIDAMMDDARANDAAARAEEANVSAELSRLDVRFARQSNMQIVAPKAGRVLRLSGGVGGEMFKAGEPLLVLVPDTVDPAVELFVDGNDAPLVTEGRKVRLQFEGWPAVQFTGWPSVAVGTFGGVVALVDSHDDGLGNFRVVVRPDPDEPTWPTRPYLRQGMRVNGWVRLDQVKLGFELWRRFSGFPPSVAKEPKPKSEAKQ